MMPLFCFNLKQKKDVFVHIASSNIFTLSDGFSPNTLIANWKKLAASCGLEIGVAICENYSAFYLRSRYAAIRLALYLCRRRAAETCTAGYRTFRYDRGELGCVDADASSALLPQSDASNCSVTQPCHDRLVDCCLARGQRRCISWLRHYRRNHFSHKIRNCCCVSSHSQAGCAEGGNHSQFPSHDYRATAGFSEHQQITFVNCAGMERANKFSQKDSGKFVGKLKHSTETGSQRFSSAHHFSHIAHYNSSRTVVARRKPDRRLNKKQARSRPLGKGQTSCERGANRALCQ